MKVEFRRHKRSKSIRISIRPSGEVLVTYPFWSNRKTAEKFLREKRDWIEKQVFAVRSRKGKSLLSRGSREDYLAKKEKARNFVQERVGKFNSVFGFRYNRIIIRNQKSRWGSCSSQKNLNFNYRIVYLPEKLADYLVVHELCHLKEMNHSKKFWQLVEKALPDYRELSKKLRSI